VDTSAQCVVERVIDGDTFICDACGGKARPEMK